MSVDPIIAAYPYRKDADLNICEEMGVAYQADMTPVVAYDSAYLGKCRAYKGGEIARAVNAGRCDLLSRHLPRGSKILDIGAGAGEFMEAAEKAGFVTFGYDVIPAVVVDLVIKKKFSLSGCGFDGLTLWDSIEHMTRPGSFFLGLQSGVTVFVSMPVFDDLFSIRKSKHYRPGEHLYYWTRSGFIGWMAAYGLYLVEESKHEIVAGRESIGAFVFVRDILRS